MTSTQLILTDHEIMSMKSKLHAMERKRDNIAIKIAKISNFPTIWTVDMIDWTIPEVANFKEEFTALDSEINELSWRISEAESIRDGTHEYFIAKQKVYEKCSKLTLQEEVDLLHSLGMTKLVLIETVMENPDFLDGVIV